MWSDPLVPTSISVAGVGALTALGGTLAWQVDSRRTYCGEVGCATRVESGSRQDIGRTFTGVGIGLALAGAVGMGATIGAPLEEGEERDGPAAATLGFLLTSMSAGMLGGGLAIGPENVSGWDRAAPFFVLSGVFASAGIPLLAAGVGREDEAERQQEAREKREKVARKNAEKRRAEERREAMARGELASEMRSPAMVGIGVSLMAAGVGGVVGFSIGAANEDTSGWFGGLNTLPWIGGALLSAGAGIGGGIPLVVFGARQVPVGDDTQENDDAEPRSSAMPARVNVGAGTVSAEWTF